MITAKGIVEKGNEVWIRRDCSLSTRCTIGICMFCSHFLRVSLLQQREQFYWWAHPSSSTLSHRWFSNVITHKTTWTKYLNAYFLAPGSEMLTRSIGVETCTAVFNKHCSFFDGYHLWATFGNATKGNRCVCVYMYGLLWWLSGKETACQYRRHRFDPWVGKMPGEGNGNSLQFSCLGSPMSTGAWQAIVHGFAKESDMT